jgi:4-diphosphocytidyl-2-C-methyl-D-erythritol kinase
VTSRSLLADIAPAKVNLTLRVVGRRADGYHLLESLVVFAGVSDRLALRPAAELSLAMRGPNAGATGPLESNLVVRAARALAGEVPGLKLGRFTLTKRLPAAAGIGGGSADAASALRLLARANRIALSDRRLLRAAAQVGADVPVCVDPRTRVMHGVGEKLSKPLRVPRWPAVMVNPGVSVPTRDVFAALHRSGWGAQPSTRAQGVPRARAAFLDYLRRRANDLEAPALELAPEISRVLDTLRRLPGCELARMSGSGATCFGLFATPRAAAAAARKIAAAEPGWWVCATHLG